MYLTQKSPHKTCYTTYGETAEQGSLLTSGSLQDTEEKGSISNTEQKKKEYQCWLPCQSVWVDLWNTALHRRHCQQSNQHLLNLVSKEEKTFVSVLVTTIQAAGVFIPKSKYVREL